MNLEKYLDRYEETTVRFKNLIHEFDVRSSAKTDEGQINELAQELKEGKKMRHPYVSVDLVLLEGRNYAAAFQRFSGEANPEIPVRMLGFIYHDLSPSEQQGVKNWSLLQNLNKTQPFRRFATFDDQYLRVKELLDNGWTEDRIRKELSQLGHTRITELIAKFQRSRSYTVGAAIIALHRVNPAAAKADPKDVVKNAGGDVTNPRHIRMAKTGEPVRKGEQNGEIRAHKFAANVKSTLDRIQKHGQACMDSYRDVQAGKTGISKTRYKKLMGDLATKRDQINHACDEVITRALKEMGEKSL